MNKYPVATVAWALALAIGIPRVRLMPPSAEQPNTWAENSTMDISPVVVDGW